MLLPSLKHAVSASNRRFSVWRQAAARLSLLVLLGATLAACMPSSPEERAQAREQIVQTQISNVALTTRRMEVIAPNCVRFMRGEPIDVAALEALGFRQGRTLIRGDFLSFRNDDQRRTQFIQFRRTDCGMVGVNHILRNESLLNAIAASLEPLGFQVSRGNRIGLNNNATLLVASDMRLFVSYPDGGTHPSIRIAQR